MSRAGHWLLAWGLGRRCGSAPRTAVRRERCRAQRSRLDSHKWPDSAVGPRPGSSTALAADGLAGRSIMGASAAPPVRAVLPTLIWAASICTVISSAASERDWSASRRAARRRPHASGSGPRYGLGRSTRIAIAHASSAPYCLQASPSSGHGAVCHEPRGARHTLHLPRILALVLLAPSTVTSTAGTTVAFRGGRKGGLGGTWNRAVIFRGRGGSGFPPSQYRIVPSPSVCAEWSRRDPDLALLSC
jgi:hypothetical protein